MTIQVRRAPPTGGAIPTDPLPPRPMTKQQEAEAAADAIKAARRGAGPNTKKEVLETAMDQAEAQDLSDALGLDVPFDVNLLLTRGIIEKKGMKVGEDFFIDMHTLNGDEDVLAEILVDEVYGRLPLSGARDTAKDICTVAVAITRINNADFPVPPIDKALRGSDEFKSAWKLKTEQVDFIRKLNTPDIRALVLVYQNLKKMDILIDEAAKKKSS